MCAVIWPFMPVFLSGSALCATFGVTRHASACASDTGARHEATTRATVPAFGNPKTRLTIDILLFGRCIVGNRNSPHMPLPLAADPTVGLYNITSFDCNKKPTGSRHENDRRQLKGIVAAQRRNDFL